MTNSAPEKPARALEVPQPSGRSDQQYAFDLVRFARENRDAIARLNGTQPGPEKSAPQ